MLHELIGTDAMLLQLAEECNELSQACIKLVRQRDGKNPTNKTEFELIENLHEECADVRICLREVIDDNLLHENIVGGWEQLKLRRMKERFNIK